MLRAQPSVLQYLRPLRRRRRPPRRRKRRRRRQGRKRSRRQSRNRARWRPWSPPGTRARRRNWARCWKARPSPRETMAFAFSGEGGSATATLTAWGEDWFGVYPRYLVAGRLPTADELQTGARVIALDEPLAFKLFPHRRSCWPQPRDRRKALSRRGRNALCARRWPIRAVPGLYPHRRPPPRTACRWRSSNCARAPLPRSGASRAFEAAGRTWRAGGTFIDTDRRPCAPA